jgi:hypothetical protein
MQNQNVVIYKNWPVKGIAAGVCLRARTPYSHREGGEELNQREEERGN